MIIRRLAVPLVGLAIASIPATALPQPAPDEPPAPHPAVYAGRMAGASIETRLQTAWVWVGEYDDAIEGCVELWDRGSGVFEFGCGPVEFSMDPALSAATIRGTIASMVYDGRKSARSSQLRLDISLEGSGLHQVGLGEGVWIAPPYVDASAGASIWRQATGSGRIDSTGLCADTGARSRRSRGRRSGSGCSPSTGMVALHEAGMAQDLAMWLGSGEGECGKSINTAAC